MNQSRPALDAYDRRLALQAPPLLAAFNQAGLISAGDLRLATRLGAIVGEEDSAVLLATALVLRSTAQGSVVLDLSSAADELLPHDWAQQEPTTSAPSAPGAPLPWPGADWAERVRASAMTRTAGPDPSNPSNPSATQQAPLTMEADRLWLSRYWDSEAYVAQELLQRSHVRPDDLDAPRLAAAVHRLFPAVQDADQAHAAQVCAQHRISVLAGGPGTGKTTTVARVLALILEQHPQSRIALAAPTGRAAARLGEAVAQACTGLPEPDRDRMPHLTATTLHRLLGRRPGPMHRFRYGPQEHLPADVVVVDESSMLSLSMMAALLAALRPTARLILVGDPDQLASVEAGAVLADLVGEHGGEPAAEPAAERVGTLRSAVSRLVINRRFAAAGGITALAEAVRVGDLPRVHEVLADPAGADQVEFVTVADGERPSDEALRGVQADVERTGRALHQAAQQGDVQAALDALDAHRLLCAHRFGPHGVQAWAARAAGWAHQLEPRGAAGADQTWRVGDPLLITRNEHDLGLSNGDTGVIVREPDTGRLVAVFGLGGSVTRVAPARLGHARPAHAMSVHRSQGSQFARVTVVLPPADSPLATRQTLYTGLTRAQEKVRIIGSPAALRQCVLRHAARATGLGERLRPPGP